MQNVFKILKKGSYAIIDVPNQLSLMAKIKILLHYLKIKKDFGYLQPPNHLFAFNHKNIVDFFKKEGFEVKKIVFVSPVDQLYFPTEQNYFKSFRDKIIKMLYNLIGKGSYISIYAKK